MANKNEIKLVIGDTLDITFLMKSEIDIKEAYFVCKDLGISERLNQTIDKQHWRLLVEDTNFLANGNFDYDIKVVFFDNTFYTACYRASFIVLQNVNYFERSV